ncbi:MAG: MlaD family protein [Gemmatimonadales bacterium]
MDLHYKREAAVGGLVIVALVVLFGGLAWLSGRDLLGGTKARFGVRYADVTGLSSGDPVMVAGVRVGRVAGFDLRGPGEVIVTLEVGRDWAPRIDAVARVKPVDMLGAMFVDYDPGRSEQLMDESVILDGARSGALLDQLGPLADRAGTVMTGAEDLISARTADDVRATLAATRRAMDALSALGTGPTMRQATETLEALAQTAARIDSTLGSPGLARSMERMDELTENLNTMLVSLGQATLAMREVMLKINRDEGTIGRMVNDTTLYNELVRLSASMRLLLDDVRERPGRYFHISVF